jgi:hypothetical protein
MPATTYIVECSICSQAWEVLEPMYSAPPLYGIAIPQHEMLRLDDGELAGVPCPGNQLPGLGLGDREDWARRWVLRKIGRPVPTVLDGTSSVHLASGT